MTSIPKKSLSKASKKRLPLRSTQKVSATERHFLPVTPETLAESIKNHLKFSLARDETTATSRDWWVATTMAVQDVVLERFADTQTRHNELNVRRVYYLSLEYLMGRLLSNNISNAGLTSVAEQALKSLGHSLDQLIEEESDMGLGNGGLGRLAACFLDSLATLDLPAIGYGIYYEFGLFQQRFHNGHQVELPDQWREFGSPWQIVRPEYSQEVKIYGHVEHRYNSLGDYSPVWSGYRVVKGLPHDIAICGHGMSTVNFLRLWDVRSSQEFDLEIFNQGGYVDAVRQKAEDETISKVLYPNDKTENGKELRLVQQYFFVSCSLQDIIRRFFKINDSWDQFPEKVSIQLNDTHPAVAVLELMRILVDDYCFHWDAAWVLCRKTFNYTNHTLLPEALEKWSLPLFERVLPRHTQLLMEINRRYLEEEVEACWPGDNEKKAALSLIEEGEPKMIRMAYLSVIGSNAVNGVAALHTELLKKDLFSLFNQLYPGKLQNKTNGITPRRWLLDCNPGLSNLISSTLGHHNWVKDLGLLNELSAYAGKKQFRKAYAEVKLANKKALASYIRKELGMEVDPHAIFDVQIKRLHEYKRQHLNLLHILKLYRDLLHNPDLPINPRVFIFAAKAAPGYDLAKNIIRAINKVGETINNDVRIKNKLKVVFLPNYSVSLAEKIIPAADVSEQISTAGKEASGTGNMKLALNGALTVGTLDGANVEIQEEVGEENIFIFGLKVDEVEALRNRGYSPKEFYENDPELKAIIDWLGSDSFTPGDPHAFDLLRHSLLSGDPFFVLADFKAYCEAQARLDAAYSDKDKWLKMAILNTARVGKFSSDRTIREYADQIWNLKSIPPL